MAQTSRLAAAGAIKAAMEDIYATDSSGNATGFVNLTDGFSYGMYLPVPTPSGFRWSAQPLNIKRTISGFVTDFDITTLQGASTNTWYVDPVSGNDGTGVVNNSSLPLKNLSTALAKAGVTRVQIINMTADFIALGVAGWNNTSNQAQGIGVINNTGYRFISVAATAVPTWIVNGTYSNVYQTTISSVNSGAVTDLKTKVIPTYVGHNGATRSLSNVPAKYKTLTQVASIAAVAATAGTWYNDGAITYVRAHDDRNLVGDTYMYPTNNANNGRLTPTANNLSFYVKDIDFVGGNRAFYNFSLSTITGTVFAHNHCSFQGAGNSGGNGFAVAAFSTVYGYRSAAYECYADGFNYHSNESDGTTPATSPSVIEIECVSQGNGETGSAGGSDNASTSHDFCNVIRLNCAYPSSSDKTVADVNSAHSWNMGCNIAHPSTVSSGKTSVTLGNSASGWYDSCDVKDGANGQWSIESTATLRHFNCGDIVNKNGSTTVTIAAYYP